MTSTTFFRFIAETLIVLAIGYCIYHEDDINKWEEKTLKKLKRGFRNIKRLGFNGVMDIIKEEIENDRNRKGN